MIDRALPARDRATARRRRTIPAWTIAVFACAIAVAYSPNIVQVFSLLDDYDVLTYRGIHFFFHNETEHLFTIARPVAALLTNLPILPVQLLDDFRWVRVFSILTVCVLGAQMMWNFIVRLKMRALDAVVLALAVFLGLAFIYATLAATAWAPHLLTTFVAFCAYTILGRSNPQCLSFLVLWTRRDYGGMGQQVFAYLRAPRVWGACLVCQIAFYDYPPFALLLTVFPVVGILFSPAARAYRTLIALRDMAFIATNVVLYSVSAALIYLPIVRLFTSKGSGAAEAYGSDFVATLYANHQFKYNFDLLQALRRIDQLMAACGDLWFLPQSRMHLVTAAVVLLALVMANVARQGGNARLKVVSWTSEGTVAIFVVAGCFVMAASPILAAAGGFVAYRTVVAPTALVAIIFIFALRSLVDWVSKSVARRSSSVTADAAMVLAVAAAFLASLDANRAIAKLSGNEYAYFSGIVRQAIDNGSKTIVIIDPRPMGGPEMYNPSPIFDQQGRAVPPRELGCLASYCLQTGTIIDVIAVRLGLPQNAFAVFVPRGVAGLTCESLTGATPNYPPNASKRSIEAIDQYRALPPVTCATLNFGWHDLDVGATK